MVPVRATVGPQGRLEIPDDVRRETGIEEGQVVVLLPAGPGRFIVTTRQAIAEEIRTMAPTRDDAENATTAVRRMREVDNRIAEEKWARIEADAAMKTGPNDVGDRLLRELGLAED